MFPQPDSLEPEALREWAIRAGLFNLAQYDALWLHDVLSLMVRSSGQEDTMERRQHFAVMLDSDLDCEFHGGDS